MPDITYVIGANLKKMIQIAVPALTIYFMFQSWGTVIWFIFWQWYQIKNIILDYPTLKLAYLSYCHAHRNIDMSSLLKTGIKYLFFRCLF